MKKWPETLADELRAAGREVDPITAADPSVAGPFIDYLMSEFPIPDREGLIEAITHAAYACEGHRAAHPTEPCWQDLYDTIRHALDLMGEMRPVLTNRLASFAGFGERAPERLDELMKTLAIVGRAGGSGLRPRGRGQKRKGVARAMLSVLASYWVHEVGRKFTQDQVWPKGEGGREEAPTVATRFAYTVIEFLAPEHGKDIKSIAKEFTGIPFLS
jgi:hypothetical protein